MKKSVYLAIAMAVLFLFPGGMALAGKVEVVNENEKELKVKIQAEGAAASYTQHIPAGVHSSFTVEKEQLKGKSHYSIKGDTNPFTPGGRCKDLDVDKNYKITFKNDALGTTCLADEIINP